MSQQTAQPTIRTKEEKSVATRENYVATEIAKESKKSCHGRVDKLKRKILVATKNIMSRQFPEAEVYKSWVQQILCRDTRHSCRNKNKTVGSKLCHENIKVYRDRIQEKAQRTGRDRKLQATTEANDKD